MVFDVEVTITLGKTKNEWCLALPRRHSITSKNLAELRKSRCFSKVELEANTLLVVIEKSKEVAALMTLMQVLQLNFTSGIPALKAHILNAQTQWFE